MRTLACLVMMVLMSIQVFAYEDGQEGLACFSPDGAILASSGNNCTVILWDTTTGKQIGQLYKPRKGDYFRRDMWPRRQPGFEPICEVFISSFSPDGKLLVTQRFDEPMIVWNAKDRRKVATLSVRTGNSHDFLVNAEFSPDSKYLITMWWSGQKLFSIAKITVWDIATQKLLLSVYNVSRPVGQKLREKGVGGTRGFLI